MHRLETKPMGGLALLATGLLYAVLLVVPVAALAFVGWSRSFAQTEAQPWRAVEPKRVEWRKQAKSASYHDLVAALIDGPSRKQPAPARADAFAATEARLHRPIPDDLRAFYDAADGIPDESIASLAQLRPVSLDDVVHADGVGKSITIYLDSHPPVEVKASEARKWWFVGGSDSTLYYLPDPDPRLPGVRVVDAWPEDPTTHASMRDYLEMMYASRKESDYYEAQHEIRLARAKRKLLGADASRLLSSWPRPNLVQSLLGHGWPGPADEADLKSAEARIGARLPGDLRMALQVHDGFPPLNLLAARDLNAIGSASRRLDSRWQRQSDFEHCVVLAASHPDPREKAKLFPLLLWCPDGRPATVVDLNLQDSYPSFKEWLFQRAANRASADD